MGDLNLNSTPFAVTSRPVEQVEFTLNVENMKDMIEMFSSLELSKDVAKCRFNVNPRYKANTEYRLKFNVVLQTIDPHLCITLSLSERENCPLPSVSIKFDIAMLDKNGETNKVATQALDMKIKTMEGIYLPADQAFMQKYFSEQKTSLSINFKVTYFVDNQEPLTVTSQEASVICSIPNKALKDFQGLLGDRDTADFEITVIDDKETIFFCHKAVLCARTSVFRKMITADMKEKAEARIVLNGISGEAFEQFIHFLYCGSLEPDNEKGEDSVPDWLKLLPELIDAAEQYDMEDLKELCDANLSRLFTKENTLDMVRMIKVYKLKRAAVELTNFISRNPNFLLE